MELTKIGKKPQNRYNIGDKVRHTNNPDIVYIVQKIFADGSYRIVPLNADISQAITFATENCMSLYDETKEGALLNPEEIYLSRAWLLAHGWEQANRIPLFQHDPEIIDADLCVIVDRKMYMIAKFHYMGDKAWEPSIMPDSFDVVGVNNNAELLEYDHTRLVLAAFVCHLTGFKVIDRAIGGVYEMTMNKTKEL